MTEVVLTALPGTCSQVCGRVLLSVGFLQPFESFSSDCPRLFRWHVASSAMGDSGVEARSALADSSMGLDLVRARPW